MAAKRKPTKAQLAALARGRATAAKNRKSAAKKTARKPARKTTSRKKAAPRKAAPRKAAPRKAPAKKRSTTSSSRGWVIMLQSPAGEIGFWTGHSFSARGGFDTVKSKGVVFPDVEAASTVARKITGVPKTYFLGVGKKT